MTCSGNHGTPVYNTATTVVSITLGADIFNRTARTCYTEYAVFISAFFTCSSLALSFAGSTDVEAPFTLSVRVGIVTVHFCLKHSFVCREGFGCAISIGYNTCFSANNQTVISGTVRIPHSVGCQDIILILHLRIVRNIGSTDTAVIHPALCHPDTNGNLSKDVGFSNFCTCAGKRNYCIVMIVDIIFSLKTVCNLHTFEFPIVDIVKIDGGGYGVYICKVISNQVKPVNRACRK